MGSSPSLVSTSPRSPGTRAPPCVRSPSSRPAQRETLPTRVLCGLVSLSLQGLGAPCAVALGVDDDPQIPWGAAPARSTIRKTRCWTASMVCPWRPMNRRYRVLDRSVTRSPSRSTSPPPSPQRRLPSWSTSWTVLSTTSSLIGAFRSSSCAADAGGGVAVARRSCCSGSGAVAPVGARPPPWPWLFGPRAFLLGHGSRRPGRWPHDALPGAPRTGNPAPRRMMYC